MRISRVKRRRQPQRSSRPYLVLALLTVILICAPAAHASVSVTKTAGYVDYDSLVYVLSSVDDFDWGYTCPNNLGGYNENDYAEYGSFGFSLGSAPTSVVIELVWRYTGSHPEGVNLKVWEEDAGIWHNETGIPITDVWSNQSRTVTGYIDTANDVNNIKIRLLGYESSSNSSVVDVDMLRVNVNSGSIIKYPGGAVSYNILPLQTSDDSWLARAARVPAPAYDENNYQEYRVFGFTMPTGSVMGAVQITYEWQWNRLTSGAVLKGAKLEVWEEDSPGWNIHNETLTLPALDTDITANINVASYINTANDINNIKLRFLGYTNNVTKIIGVRPDYLSIYAKRKIVASDISIYGPDTATYYPGNTNKVILSFKIPDDDGGADTLNELYAKNQGTAADTGDLANVRACEDYSPLGEYGVEDTCYALAWDAGNSWWYITGQSIAIPAGGKRMIVVSDITSNPTDARTIQMSIPMNGLVVASTYSGPTNAARTNTKVQTIDGMVAAQITNTNAPAATAYAGDTNLLAMDFTIPLNGTSADTLTGLRVKNSGTAINTTDISAVRAWAEDGTTPGFQTAEDTSLGALTWSAPNAWWAKTNISLAYSSAQRLYITVDIASNPTDGRTAQMYLPQGGTDSTAGVVVSSGNDGPLGAPITNASAQTIDGMIAAQLTNTGAPVDTLYANETNKLVMNFVLPPNGATAGTLTGLRVQNTGTAVDGTDIAAVKLWADADDDGGFEPTGDDAPALGTASWNAGGWWEHLTLSETIPVGGQRFFVSVNTAATPTPLNTIQMALKQGGTDATAGVVMNSGNDGPLNAQVINTNVQTLKRRLAVSGVDKAPISASLGSTNNTMLQLQCTASQGTIQISTVQVALSGTAQDTDIDAAKLWDDVNDDGSWDGGDAQISTTQTFSGGTLTFGSVGFDVTAGTTESLIITYDIDAAAVSGRTAGVSLANSTYMTVSAPASDNVIFEAEPIVSSNSLLGSTLTVTGYDQAPAQVTPNDTDRVFEQLKLESSGGTITATSVKVELSGSGTSADISSAKLYDDVDEDGAYTPGTDDLLDTQTFSGSPAYATFSISYDVTAGTPEYLIIAYDIAAGATPGNTVGASIPGTTYITASAGENIYFANTIQSTNASIGQSLSVSGTDKAPATVQVDETGVEMLWLTLTASSGSITMTGLKVDRTGTGADGDTASVKLYDDANDDGALDGGDTLLSTKTFTGGTLTFNSLSYTVTNPTGEHLLVVFNISGSATTGNTVGATIIDNTYVTIDTGTVSPFSSISSINSEIVTTLTVSGTDRAASLVDVTKGQSDVVFEQLTLDAAAGTIDVVSVKVDLSGTGADGDISAARLFHDVNNNGTYESGTDTQLGTDKTFSGSTLTFDSFTFPVAAGTTENLLIPYSISGAATQGNTVGVSLANSTYITTSPAAGVTVDFNTTPITSTNLTVKNIASLTANFVPVDTPQNPYQDFDVILTVSNAAGSSRADGVAPEPPELTKIYVGGAGVTLMSGPEPASADIGGGDSQNFAYVFRPISGGTVQFEAAAIGTDTNLGTTVSSATATSNVVTIINAVVPIWTFSDGGATQAFYGSGAPRKNPSGTRVLYIGNQNGKLYSVRISDGVKMWKYNAVAAIRSTPYVIGYVLYFGDENGNLHAVQDNGGTDTPLWNVAVAGGAIRSASVPWKDVSETRLYFGSLDGFLYCRKASDGSTCTGWSDANLGSAIYSTPALPNDGYVYVGTSGGNIAKVDRTTGIVTSTFTGYTNITAPPFVYPQDPANPLNGAWLWIGALDNTVYKIDTTQPPGSEQAWSFSPSSPIPAEEVRNSVFVDVWRAGQWGSLTVYAGNDNGCVYAITDAGVQKWKYPAGSDYLSGPVASCPLLDPSTGIIYFGADDNKIYALRDDPTTPTLVDGWPYATADRVRACPSMYGNYVMIPSEDGKVYGFPR